MTEKKSPQPAPTGATDISQMATNPGMSYDAKKKMPVLGQNVPEKTKKQMDETRKKLEKFQKDVLKKYKFTIWR